MLSIDIIWCIIYGIIQVIEFEFEFDKIIIICLNALTLYHCKIRGCTFCLSFKGQRYSALYAKFILQRHAGYFLINVYVPCSLLVAISWVAFWINREATADRIALGKCHVRYVCITHSFKC